MTELMSDQNALPISGSVLIHQYLFSFFQPEGITVYHQVYLCESRWKTLWLGVLLGYKVITQGIGVFLAFKIRKVKVRGCE
jgi:hypothetical protein